MGKNCFNLTKKKIKSQPSKNSDLSSEPSTSDKAQQSTSLSLQTKDSNDLRQVFNRYDTNGDGKISSSELGSMLKCLGNVGSTEEIESMMKVADLDGDGYISLEEFISLNKKGADSESCMEDLRNAFTLFDRDGNGLISAKELHQVMQGMGEKMSLDDCKSMIKGIDRNGDGAVNFEEFIQMMTRSSN